MENRVERQSVSLEDILNLVPGVVLQIIDKDDVIETTGEIPSGKQADFLVAIRNPFAAADHPLPSSCRPHGPKLGDSASDLERAVPFSLERSEEAGQELLLALP